MNLQLIKPHLSADFAERSGPPPLAGAGLSGDSAERSGPLHWRAQVSRGIPPSGQDHSSGWPRLSGDSAERSGPLLWPAQALGGFRRAVRTPPLAAQALGGFRRAVRAPPLAGPGSRGIPPSGWDPSSGRPRLSGDSAEWSGPFNNKHK